ncbi:MAG: hypothetical protein AAF327_24465, partial [Cyanobacteria bacterium P01_A01_bin.37]
FRKINFGYLNDLNIVENIEYDPNRSARILRLFSIDRKNHIYVLGTARMLAFRQLGFAVLAFDDRGYGQSEGHSQREAQLYEDSQVMWRYFVAICD